jgi:hypothetical protein
VGVGVAVGVWVGVDVTVGVWVGVGIRVEVGIDVPVAVGVAVALGASVGVSVMLGVGVMVGTCTVLWRRLHPDTRTAARISRHQVTREPLHLSRGNKTCEIRPAMYTLLDSKHLGTLRSRKWTDVAGPGKRPGAILSQQPRSERGEEQRAKGEVNTRVQGHKPE